MKNIFCLMLLTATLTQSAIGQYSPQDEKALNTIVATMQKGWNARSGATYSSVFASRHDYIVWNGMYAANQTTEANARGHQGIFDSVYKNVDVELKIDKIRYVREDLALVHVLGATYDRGTPVPANPKVLISMLIEKKAGEWKVISFHNCDIELSFEPDAQNGTPVPPQQMYASWYGKS